MSRPGAPPGGVKLYVLSNGEYAPKFQEDAPIVMLRGAGKGDPVSRWVPLAMSLFGRGGRSLFVLDVADVVKDMPRETSVSGLGPVTKPIARLLEKFNAMNAVFVGVGATCSVLAKLARQEACRPHVASCVVVAPGAGDDVATLRDPLPEKPVPFHLVQLADKQDPKEVAVWQGACGDRLTTSVAPAAEGGVAGLMTAIGEAVMVHLDGGMGYFDSLPPPGQGWPQLRAAEVLYGMDKITKQQETNLRRIPVEQPPAPASATAAAAPAAAPSSPVHVDPSPSAPAAVPVVTPPEGYPDDEAVDAAAWWDPERDEEFFAESHVWGIRCGAAVDQLAGQITHASCPAGAKYGWARLLDLNGSVRVSYPADMKGTFMSAFIKPGTAVSISGRVVADCCGRLFVSVPPDPDAVKLMEGDELSMAVPEDAAAVTQTLTEVGVGVGDVQHRVGCVLVRGRKIALARSKTKAGHTQLGMPSLVPEGDEAPEAAAMRCLMEALDVDLEEFVLLPQLGTLTRFPAPGVVETLYFATAASAPPGGKKNDSKDLPVDTDSPYDWFLLRHALKVTSHGWHAHLWEAARRVHSAYHAGILRLRFNCGLFGVQEVAEEHGA
eukprot:TRINITY_DN13003_c0_g1_i1.p1 TRINITY_DN13003_c0_g1~~TRINITY_DN13003_c0_g1_i1.p1  ORF type:complete len:607 (+),score=222.93 TRINITY_DN13003_c0_g1_i1:67-1887(+)